MEFVWNIIVGFSGNSVKRSDNWGELIIVRDTLTLQSLTIVKEIVFVPLTRHGHICNYAKRLCGIMRRKCMKSGQNFGKYMLIIF